MGVLKLKTNNMNNDAYNDATNEPLYLDNDATPDAAIFDGAAPSPTFDAASGTTSTAVSTIVSDAHISPSEQQQHTNPFYPVNMKNMAKKDTINPTPVPEFPTAVPSDASARSPGLIVCNSPYSLRNCNFSPAP